MSEATFVVIESSKAGDSVLGVFSSYEKARALLPPVESGRLGDYRIECHVVDEPLDLYSPWQVSINRYGEVEGVEPVIACAYCDEEYTVVSSSFAEADGRLIRLGVWARTRGAAIAAAEAYAQRLLDDGGWPSPGSLVSPIHTEEPAAAPS